MNKKYFVLTLGMVMVFLFGGCTKKDEPEQQLEVIEEVTESVTDIMETTSEAIKEINESYPELGIEKPEETVSYAAMLPDPFDIFQNGSITIDDSDGGDYYIFSVTDYTADEFNFFVQSLKNLGWTDSVYDVEDAYGAYSSDGNYWIEISIGQNQGVDTVYVVCNRRKNED